MSFDNWLREQINTRGWDGAELARRSNVTRGQISRVLSGSRGAGPDLCIAIAQGLNLPRQQVFRARGWLLDESEKELPTKLSVEAIEVATEIDKLPLTLRQIVLELAKASIQIVRNTEQASLA